MNQRNQRKDVILVAEDDPDDRLLVEEALRPLTDDLLLRFVEDGEELMRCCHDPDFPQPRLILLNLNMPVKNGFQALTEIKQDACLRQIPIIIWTTSSDEDERRFCLKEGAEEYVTKPNNFADMTSVLGKMVNQWLQSANHAEDRPAAPLHRTLHGDPLCAKQP